MRASPSFTVIELVVFIHGELGFRSSDVDKRIKR